MTILKEDLTLNRRDAIQRVAYLMGGALSAPTMIAMLGGCKLNTATEAANSFSLSTDYKSLVAEIAEIIIPKTSTPGAKDANVGAFIEMMLKDCYTPAQQDHVVKGLDALEEASKKSNEGKRFLESTPSQQTTLLKSFEALSNEEAKKNEGVKKIVDAETGLAKETKGKEAFTPTPFFKIIKELTLLGYFTSEVGCKESLAYVDVPGKYEGCVKMTPGQKAWALN